MNRINDLIGDFRVKDVPMKKAMKRQKTRQRSEDDEEAERRKAVFDAMSMVDSDP